ncbi:hypothetical protein TWF718_006687 [Orbilia javanica]|uniref:Uncharacterized protein n=1 Tax=Orbilia javanica TaxID=47235 RepID=A0AAN8N1J6_9PEZI
MTLIPALIPPKNSHPVPAEFLQGYFPNLEPRVHNKANEELREASEMYEGWINRGGYECHLTVVPKLGGVMSLTTPEAEPEKLVHISALTAFASVEDDFYDGDVFSSPEASTLIHIQFESKANGDPSQNRASLTKKYQNVINQTKSKLFVELLENDDTQNRYIQAYEGWKKSSTELETEDPEHLKEFRDLEEYMAQRLDSMALSCFWNLVPIIHNFNFSDQEIQKFDRIDQLAYRMVMLTNDLYSAEKEWIAHVGTNKPGIPASSLFIIMRIHDVSFGEAKEIMKQKWLEMEKLFLKLRDELMAECGVYSAPEYARYLSCLQHLLGGVVVFSMHCPRYISVTPEKYPLCPKPEHRLKDLPRKPQPHGSRKENGLVNGTLVNKYTENGYHNSGPYGTQITLTIGKANETQTLYMDKAPWLSKYPRLPDEVILEPVDYIKSLPSKGIRNVAIDALDFWYMVPQRSVEIIKNIISMLHTSSLMIDDIEDRSDLRRGEPSAHMVFGIPQAINSANYLFVKCIFEAQKLSPSAVAIFEDELRNLHIGQGLDIHWTFHQKCPSESEYIQMIDGKTGGLFRMASRLMRDQATQNRDLEVEDLITLMGRFFQIRDDYQNLGSVDYARAKGSLSDLDEGKYSLMLIHALNNQKHNHQLRSLLQTRSQNGILTKEQKNLIMKIMGRSRSMEYTAMVLEDLRIEIDVKLGYIEEQLSERGFKEDKNWMIRAIMARLRLPDPYVGTLEKR